MTYLENIYNLIGIDIQKFLDKFVSFYKNDYGNIVQYYTIDSFNYPKESMENMKNLLEEANQILSKLSFYKGNFNNIDYWNILSKIDEIKEKLECIPSYPKFYKLSIVKNKDNKDICELYISKQNETLQQIADKCGEDKNDLALFNDLSEENFKNSGGVLIKLKSTVTKASKDIEPINSIVDVAIGDNVLGKDLPQYLLFDSDNNDIKVEDPQNTFITTANRLFQYIKGSTPEYPDIGIDKDILFNVGKGDETLFPILLRQLTDVLFTDDTIIDVTIDNIDKKDDIVYIKATIKNRLLDNLQFVTPLQN